MLRGGSIKFSLGWLRGEKRASSVGRIEDFLENCVTSVMKKKGSERLKLDGLKGLVTGLPSRSNPLTRVGILLVEDGRVIDLYGRVALVGSIGMGVGLDCPT